MPPQHDEALADTSPCVFVSARRAIPLLPQRLRWDEHRTYAPARFWPRSFVSEGPNRKRHGAITPRRRRSTVAALPTLRGLLRAHSTPPSCAWSRLDPNFEAIEKALGEGLRRWVLHSALRCLFEHAPRTRTPACLEQESTGGHAPFPWLAVLAGAVRDFGNKDAPRSSAHLAHGGHHDKHGSPDKFGRIRRISPWHACAAPMPGNPPSHRSSRRHALGHVSPRTSAACGRIFLFGIRVIAEVVGSVSRVRGVLGVRCAFMLSPLLPGRLAARTRRSGAARAPRGRADLAPSLCAAGEHAQGRRWKRASYRESYAAAYPQN